MNIYEFFVNVLAYVWFGWFLVAQTLWHGHAFLGLGPSTEKFAKKISAISVGDYLGNISTLNVLSTIYALVVGLYVVVGSSFRVSGISVSTLWQAHTTAFFYLTPIIVYGFVLYAATRK
ncbi:hypothetical protein GR28A_00058 [Vibrio phage vB_VcorM_GR28A]|nr:hypothetical protein GR28A_00058 [Vibrio phage vB_VcorM_GR28A]